MLKHLLVIGPVLFVVGRKVIPERYPGLRLAAVGFGGAATVVGAWNAYASGKKGGSW